MDKYFVFMVYYKKGKYKVKEFDTEDEMGDFLISYLKKYSKYTIIKNLRNASLYELIAESIKVGSIVLDEREGYAVVKAVGGGEVEDSEESGDFEDSYQSSYTSDYDIESEELEYEDEENEEQDEESDESDEENEEQDEEDEESDESEEE
jgi:hypothetical protein